MNLNAVMNCLYSGPVVQVTFDPNNPKAKLYTYKCPVQNVQVGESLFVNVSDEIKIVQVLKVGDENLLDPNASYLYKWVCGKVQFPEYEQAVAREKELATLLANKQRADVRAKILEDAGLSTPAIEALS